MDKKDGPIDLESLRGFTEGPWALWGKADPSQTIAAKTAKVFVAQTVGGNDKANARLIAAAPSMHAELTTRRARDAEVEALVASWYGRAAEIDEIDSSRAETVGTLTCCADELSALTGAKP